MPKSIVVYGFPPEAPPWLSETFSGIHAPTEALEPGQGTPHGNRKAEVWELGNETILRVVPEDAPERHGKQYYPLVIRNYYGRI